MKIGNRYDIANNSACTKKYEILNFIETNEITNLIDLLHALEDKGQEDLRHFAVDEGLNFVNIVLDAERLCLQRKRE